MKIWITYARENEDFVRYLKKNLQDAQLEVIDYESGIMPGDNVEYSISQSISSADIMLAVLPKRNEFKERIFFEIGLMVGQTQNNSHKRMIPILLDNQSRIPSFINQYQYLDLTNDNNSKMQIEKLIEMLKLLDKKDIFIKKEQEYKRKSKQKQYMLFMTLIATIMTTFATIITFMFASEDFFSFNIDKDIVLYAVSATIVLLVGVFGSIILGQLKKK
jgi:hypothetical protein